MTERDTFLRAILADPDDDIVRLAYADWLDEQCGGVDPRAEFIRIQCEQAREITDREQKLFRIHGMSWWAEVCEDLGLPVPKVYGRRIESQRSESWPYWISSSEKNPSTTIECNVKSQDTLISSFKSCRFSRGFPEDLTLRSGNGLSISDWVRVIPLRTLVLPPMTGDEWACENTPALKQIRNLFLILRDPKTMASIVASPHIGHVESLSCHTHQGEPISDYEMRILARSAMASHLKFIMLYSMTEEAVTEFASHNSWSRLDCLYISIANYNASSVSRCVCTLAGSPAVSELTRFSIMYFHPLSSETVDAICNGRWTQLENLSLHIVVDDHPERLLSQIERLTKLTSLSIEAVFTQSWIDVFAVWSGIRKLQYLTITHQLSLSESADSKIRWNAIRSAFNKDFIQNCNIVELPPRNPVSPTASG